MILDIFAQNARTQEGKAQVELALLRYRLPRLRGPRATFSQQAGGIGTRGPGETQLEVDRRRLLRRMTRLEADLRQVDRHPPAPSARLAARSRQRAVSLVGYTNAGKSTLLNRLTDADVLVEDRLFSTLDPRTRRLALPGGETVLVSDTVGFVRKLPHQLVEAFRSTLEVVREADLLVHVVDGVVGRPRGRRSTRCTVLDEIDAADVPELLVVNKADRRPGPCARASAPTRGRAWRCRPAPARASTRLLRVLGDRLRVRGPRRRAASSPSTAGDVLAAVHREGEVVDESHGEGATVVHVVLDDAGRARFRPFVAS